MDQFVFNEFGYRILSIDIGLRLGKAQSRTTLDVVFRWAVLKTKLAPFIDIGYSAASSGDSSGSSLAGYLVGGGLRYDLVRGQSSVISLLAELPRIGFFRLEEGDGLLRVRGQFHELAFDKRARQLAALFMCAAEHGAQGTVSFLGEGVWLGYEIFLDGGRAKLTQMSEDAVRRAAHDPALDAISAAMSASTSGFNEMV